jgi:hypothetical protein
MKIFDIFYILLSDEFIVKSQNFMSLFISVYNFFSYALQI